MWHISCCSFCAQRRIYRAEPFSWQRETSRHTGRLMTCCQRVIVVVPVLWWADRPTGSQKLEGTVQARPGTFEAGAASGKEVTRRAEDNREKEYHSCAPFNSQLLPVCTLHIEGLSAAEPCCPGFHASPCILCSRLHFFLILALALDALCASSSM